MNSTSTQMITSTFSRLLVLFGSFGLSVILARYLGPEGKGTLTALFVIPSILVSLADLGVKQSTAYYIGQKRLRADQVVKSILTIWVFSSIIAFSLALFYFSLGSINSYGWGLVGCALLTIPLLLFEKYMDGIFLGIQKIHLINLKQILNFIVNFSISIFLVVILDLNVIGASVAILVAGLATMYYSLSKVRKYFELKFEFDKSVMFPLLKKGFFYSITLFILSLNYKIDVIFLERLSSVDELGQYSVAVSLAELIWQIPTAIGMVLFSKSATSKDEQSAIFRTAQLLRIIWIPSLLIGIFLCIVAPYFLPLIYGQEYKGAVNMLWYLMPGILTMVIFKLLNSDLAGRGHIFFSLKSYIVALLINIFANIILIPNYGGEGAAIASSISYSIGSLLIVLGYKRAFRLTFKELFVISQKDVKILSRQLSFRKDRK